MFVCRPTRAFAVAIGHHFHDDQRLEVLGQVPNQQQSRKFKISSSVTSFRFARIRQRSPAEGVAQESLGNQRPRMLASTPTNVDSASAVVLRSASIRAS